MAVFSGRQYGFSVAASAVFVGAAFALAGPLPGLVEMAAVASLGVALFCVFLVLRYRAAIRRIQQAVKRAQEGLLEPVERDRNGGPFLRSIADDYNTMIFTLRRMFSTVEECQARVLNERNKIDAILQSLPGALLYLADDLDVAGVNKTAEQLFGVPAKRLISTNLFDLLEVGEHDRDLLRDAFLYKRPVRNQEIRIFLGGGERWLSMNLVFINDNETDLGAVITLQDVTDYRQLQDSVAIREKLVAMGQLAAGVAHELNTPLGNMLGYSQLLREAAGGQGKLTEYADIIGEETKRCSRIVQDLLNYARQDRCSGDPCDIGPLIGELVETFVACRLRRHNISVTLDLPAAPLLVDRGCGQLDIVLTNLILNAMQAVSSVEEPAIRIGAQEESGFVAVFVEDNGGGIPPDLRSRIFDPFFTTKDVGDGSGLGLSISQAMMVRRGGYIRHDPEYTGGARFILRLPAVQAE